MLAEGVDRQLAPRVRAARSGMKFSTLLRSVCVFGLGALVLGLAWHEQPVGVVADDAIYLLMADRLSPFAAGAASDSAFIDRYTYFPPLYPMVLAVLGGGSEAILPARLVSAGCLLLGLLATWAWLRREIEPWAGALTVVLGLLPGMVLLAVDLRSEHLYLALSIGALYVASRDASSPRNLWIAAALVGFAALARSAGFALVLAFSSFVLLRRVEQRWLLVGLCASPFLVNGLLDLIAGPGGGYGSELGVRYRDGVVNAIAVTVRDNARALWAGWVALLGLADHPYANIVAALLAAPAVIGSLLRLTARRLDALYLAAYVGMLLVWPAGPEHARRFLAPVAPVALCHAIWGLQIAAPHVLAPHRRGGLPGAYLIALIAVITPALIAYAARFTEPLPNGLENYRYTTSWLEGKDSAERARAFWRLQHLVDAYRLVRDHVPPDDCVFVVHPELFMFHARRLAFPPPRPAVDDATFERRIRRCRYVFISAIATHAHLAPTYPLERLPERRTVFTTTLPGHAPGEISTTLLELLPP